MPESRPSLHLTIIGSGAMACLYGARLSSVARITLTDAWVEGIEAIRSGGIVVEESGSRVPVFVNAVPWGGAIASADLVLVLVKAWQTREMARGLPSLLKPEGVALTLQNGLGNLEALGPRAYLGVTYQGATLLGPGRTKPGGAGPTWIAGPEWIARLFADAGFEAQPAASDQVDGLLWGKLVVNCGINALTAVLRIPNGELLRRSEARSLMREAAKECADVARARGIRLPFADPEEEVCEVARKTAVNRSSMLQDVLRGAPTECEAIYGALVDWGRRLGVPTPVNEVLLRLVRASARIAETE